MEVLEKSGFRTTLVHLGLKHRTPVPPSPPPPSRRRSDAGLLAERAGREARAGVHIDRERVAIASVCCLGMAPATSLRGGGNPGGGLALC